MSDQLPKASRRGFFLSATAAGVAVGAGALLKQQAASPIAELAKPPVPVRGGGYSLSEHVKRYYKTTLV
jgi:hypothetical protein